MVKYNVKCKNIKFELVLMYYVRTGQSLQIGIGIVLVLYNTWRFEQYQYQQYLDFGIGIGYCCFTLDIMEFPRKFLTIKQPQMQPEEEFLEKFRKKVVIFLKCFIF